MLRAVFLTLAVILTAVGPTTLSAAPAPSLPPYTNHTVGGPTGWSFNSKKNSSAINYSSWAKSQTSFYLGDYLIFTAKSNLTSVVQTTNSTTYQNCDAGDDSTASIYSGNGGDGEIEVPLTAEGENYFFSGDGDGIECAKGMKFAIKVGKGRGLPAALSQPPPPPQSDVQVPPPPDTVVGGNVGGSPQGESFYTGGVGGGAHIWVGFLVVLLGLVLASEIL